MKIKFGLEEAYKDWFEKNDDPYGRRCFTYAEDWANLLEKKIEEIGLSPQEIITQFAKECGREADTDGITGFMYGMSVSILSKCWEHGESLRCWHNLDTQIGSEGEEANKNGTVINPALLNIG